MRVPADFGKSEVTWTITANGRTEKAFGNLMPAEEITDRVVSSNGNFDPGADDPNEPPSIQIASVQAASVGTPFVLSASIIDDGLPKPRPVPTPRTPSGAFGAQVNSSGGGGTRGLTVRWIQYRGPAKAEFDSSAPTSVKDGRAVTTVQFSEPGVYQLRIIASDGALSSQTIVTVNVTSRKR
jgi:hypothetical protein